MQPLTAKNSFNSGDLITVLCGLNHVFKTKGFKTKLYQQIGLKAFYYEGATHPVQINGEQVCMNADMFCMLQPLIESQEYIQSFEVWEGQKTDIDFDVSRDRKAIPMPSGNIHHYAFFIAPELQCDLSKEWLTVYPLGAAKTNKGEINITDKVIVNRTQRYQNPFIEYYFLKQYEDKIAFSGTQDEYKDFCEKYKLDIPHIQVKDFLELARLIYSSKGIICNQSFNYHLADAMKVPRILEVCSAFPNCFPTGKNGYAFLYQQALELYTHKLINNEL